MIRALYTPAFETAWKSYGRREEKRRAFAAWADCVREAGDEAALLAAVVEALAWQAPRWAEDGWRFAPYFERYLKRHKWEDEPPPEHRAARRQAPESFTARDARETREREAARLAKVRAAQEADERAKALLAAADEEWRLSKR